MKAILKVKSESYSHYFGHSFKVAEISKIGISLILKTKCGLKTNAYFKFTEVFIVDVLQEIETAKQRHSKCLLEHLLRYCGENNINV